MRVYQIYWRNRDPKRDRDMERVAFNGYVFATRREAYQAIRRYRAAGRDPDRRLKIYIVGQLEREEV